MTTMTATTDRTTIPGPPILALDYPMSLGSHEDYRQAQQVVDDLTDRGFPVENLMIVGTDLKSMERVTGRLTRRKLATAAGLSGLWMGLFVGIAFALFSTHGQLGFLITTPLLGALFGVIWSQLGFRAATRGGARDFLSVTQMTASRYEVLVEHRVAAQAHQLLSDGRTGDLRSDRF